MATQNESLTLCGGQARRFREIQEELEEQLGYEPTKPQVVGRLMEKW